MLVSLYVKDFAIVGEADITLRSGLTVVTGETGAGKSLLVDALLLLSGARADAGVVRLGCDRAELAAEFDLADAQPALAWLRAEELDDGQTCQLRRVIRSEGASRAWINGRPATLAQLGAVCEHLIEIHGQHEHQALLQRGHQLALLDAFGGHAATLDHVAALARQWRELGARILQLSSTGDHAEELAHLERQLGDLDRYAISPEQLLELDETHKRLANAGQLLQGSSAVSDLLDGDSEFSARRALARSHAELLRLTEVDPGLAGSAELVESAQIHLAEVSERLARYQNNLELDPERMVETEQQLAKLHELARRHRLPMAGLKAHADELREQVDSLRDASGIVEQLSKQRTRLQADYSAAAAVLSAARSTAAERLAREVSTLMGELGMTGGRFSAALEPLTRNEPDVQGAERCEFMVSANPGQPLRALRKVASGGELSRISLAIEVAALGLDEVGTMVFDEVDSGIGGAVAEVVGQKLRRLGAQRQALCVTHLPQVAAQGQQHFKVEKSSVAGDTSTRISALDDKQRRDEIARMLGGIDITRETLAHARQMLERAQAG